MQLTGSEIVIECLKEQHRLKHNPPLLLTEGLEETFVFSGQERGIVLETVDQG